ncbi:hypothetical protein [Actinomadura decatromicini]|uniref:Uncharacterized protein n=1 Tax=Actinomadura decatromicini TaxID=2604572 RepID=A0A5D3FE38_9ACTN|nr:hypothetical protein [Actinomadura decatromicini]TYK46156.1 hypothetical protein FXF68_28610 [Actinomadura decatromicini]
MPRKLPDLSTTQLIASAAATGVAALGASYLGVYGTIIGAALMSVISTAGSAIGKHYLDQGREQLKELSHVQVAVRRRDAADHAAEAATSADPTRTVAWPHGAAGLGVQGGGDPNATRRAFQGGDPNATRLDPSFGGGDPNATRLDPMFGGGDPNATRLDPVAAVAGSLAEEAGEDAVREVVRRSAWQSTAEWAKAHWVKLVVSSAVVFAIVIGGITLYEATTGKPIGKSDKGLTVTNVLGGDGGGKQDDTPAPTRTDDTTEPSGTPTGTPTGEAPSTQQTAPGGQQPTGPTETPTQQEPTGRPTTPTPTAPSTPAPTENPQDGGKPPGGAEQQRSTPGN